MIRYFKDNFPGILYLAIWTTLSLGFIILRLFDCFYFLWVYGVWLIASILLIVTMRHHWRILSIIFTIILVGVITGKLSGIVRMESNVDIVNNRVYTDYSLWGLFMPSTFLDTQIPPSYSTPYYEYKNFIWYGSEQGTQTHGGMSIGFEEIN
jgi:hypothetical protein